MFTLVFQRLFLEAFLDLFYFPIWWYSKGAWHALKWCGRLMKMGDERIGLGVWAENIFVPMFGQYDWQGRIVSFFMRLVQIIFRCLALVVWLLICLALFICWLALPVIVVYGMVRSGVK